MKIENKTETRLKTALELSGTTFSLSLTQVWLVVIR
jgi:hypothetical protein